MSSGRYIVIGIDTGATRSRFLATDNYSNDLAYIEGPAFNLRQSSMAKFGELVSTHVFKLLNQLDADTSSIAAIGVGAAGLGTPKERASAETTFRSIFPDIHIACHHDAFAAHFGAFDGDPGVIVIAGTGSIAYARDAEGHESRAGGWGWMLGDEGSGWWIGREMIRAALAQWEGSRPATILSQELRDRFLLADTYDIVPKLYAGEIDRAAVADLAEIVVYYMDKDQVAAQILEAAGTELGRLAIRAVKSIGMNPPVNVALLGGIAENAGKILEKGVENGILASLNSDRGTNADPLDFKIVSPVMDAAHGAAAWVRSQIEK